MKAPTMLAAGLVLTTVFSTFSQAQEPLGPATEVEKVPFEPYLGHLCWQVESAYFTMERVGSRADIPREIRRKNPSPFHRDDLMTDPGVKTLESLVAKLRRDLKGIAVIRNAKNPAVIHLIDERLLKIEGYVMDKKVDVTYSGLIDELAGEVGKHAPGIGFSRGGSLHEIPGDFRTPVKVDAKNQTVRDVLTDCVPLKDYHKVLWHTDTTEKEDGRYSTIVRYHGLVRLPPEGP